MDTITLSVLILSLCGLLSGILLGLASWVLAVKNDPRIEAIEKILPGANCGGCGYPSCYEYAKSMVENDAEPNRCVLAKNKSEEIGKVLGKTVSSKVPKIAAIKCARETNFLTKYEYNGISSCRTAEFFAGGDSCCQYSCLGFGDCITVCPFQALSHNGRNVPLVNPYNCTGCGKCVAACPRNLIDLIPVTARPFLACNTEEKGKAVSTICPVGCIGCKLCIKACPENAISMKNRHIQIDYNKCTNCGICIEKCPRKIIRGLIPAKGLKGLQSGQR